MCHSSQKEMTSDLADLMAHKEDNAKRYTVYYLLLAFQSVYYFVGNNLLDFRFYNLMWPVGTCGYVYKLYLHCVRLRVALSFLSAVLQEGIVQFLNCLKLLGLVYKQVG